MPVEDNLPLTDEEIQEIIEELRPIINMLESTTEPKENLALVDLELTPLSKSGSCETIVQYLSDSFSHLNRYLDVPQGWMVEIGIVDENVTQGFVELMWSLRCKGRGSLNSPHVIIRRKDDLYEILLPQIPMHSDDKN
jgi:uncharacterized protein YbdZ (MbtH family)